MNDDAVAEVLGSVLFTVIMVAFVFTIGAQLVDRNGPEENLNSDLQVRLSPGQGGWGSGDEALRIEHLGGEPVPAEGAVLRYGLDGDSTKLTGTAIGGPFTDGFFTLGEIWDLTTTISSGTEVSVQLVASDPQQLGHRSVVLDRSFRAGAAAGDGGGSGGVLSVTWDSPADWDTTTGVNTVHEAVGDRSDDVVVLGSSATAPDLVSYWPLDDANGPVPDAAGSAHGTAHNVVRDRTGIHGTTAFRFDDNAWVALDRSYQGGGSIPEMSACVWFSSTESSGGTNSNWAFIDFDRSEYFNFFLRGDDGRLGFATRADSGGIKDMYGATPANDGLWHHACAVYDGVDKILYLDGVEDARDANAHGGHALGHGNRVRYGFLGDGSEAGSFDGNRNRNYYRGLLDEVRLYHRGITAAEVQALAADSGTITTAWVDSTAPIDGGTLVLTDVTATLNNGSITVRVEVDTDGDGAPDAASNPVGLATGVPGPYSVTGLGAADRHRLVITLTTSSATTTPVLDAITLEGSG